MRDIVVEGLVSKGSGSRIRPRTYPRVQFGFWLRTLDLCGVRMDFMMSLDALFDVCLRATCILQIYIYTHTYILIFIYIYIYIYIYKNVYACVCVYIYIWIYIYTHLYIDSYTYIHTRALCWEQGAIAHIIYVYMRGIWSNL